MCPVENNIITGITAFETLFRGYKRPLPKKQKQTDSYKQVHEFYCLQNYGFLDMKSKCQTLKKSCKSYAILVNKK